MKRIAIASLVAFLAAWFVPVSDKAASALSWICLIVAGGIIVYLVASWLRVTRQIRADMSFDPIRRPEPDYLKRHRINTKHATRFKP